MILDEINFGDRPTFFYQLANKNMSHSVFRDFDDDKSSGNSSKSGVADNNLIVFINKDGGVQVDPNALQDLIGKIFLIDIFNDHQNSSVMIQFNCYCLQIVTIFAIYRNCI